MKEKYEDIELKKVLEQSFAAGHGVVTLSASMTDEQILMFIKSACTWSNGKAFQVIPSQPTLSAESVASLMNKSIASSPALDDSTSAAVKLASALSVLRKVEMTPLNS